MSLLTPKKTETWTSVIPAADPCAVQQRFDSAGDIAEAFTLLLARDQTAGRSLFEACLLCREDRCLQAFNRLPGRRGYDLSQGLARLELTAERGCTDAQVLRLDAVAAKPATTESMAEKGDSTTLPGTLLQSVGLRLGDAPGGNRRFDLVVPRGFQRSGESTGRDIEMLGHVVDVGLTAGTGRALRRGHGHSATGTAQQDETRRADYQFPTRE
ncbi:MAG: hypothetical protein ACLQMH_01105 [Solirubrobacteraceae bacterium]